MAMMASTRATAPPSAAILARRRCSFAPAVWVLWRAGQDGVADPVGLASAHEIGEITRLAWPHAGVFRRGTNAIGEAPKRIGAGAGLDDMPDGLVGTGLVRPAKAATAESGNRTRQHQ